MNELLELRSQNHIELQVTEVKKRGSRRELGTSGYNLVGLDLLKSKILAELKKRQNISISYKWLRVWN